MKAARLWILAVCLWLAGLSAAAAEPPRVVVTIKPIHTLVASILGDIAVPELLVRGQASPHTYALRPSQAKSLYEADVFFRVADAVDPFATKIAAALPARVTTLALVETPDLVLLQQRRDASFEGHAHDHDDHKPDETSIDGHVWLDPRNARTLARHIAHVLAKRFPPYAAQLERNRAALDARLAALDQELEAATAPVRHIPFAVHHDAFHYFESRYGLKAVGSLVISPDAPASGKRLADLRRDVARLGAACVFGEPQSDPRLLQAIVEGTKVRTGTLDAEGLALEPGTDLYFTLMRALVRDLRACLLS